MNTSYTQPFIVLLDHLEIQGLSGTPGAIGPPGRDGLPGITGMKSTRALRHHFYYLEYYQFDLKHRKYLLIVFILDIKAPKEMTDILDAPVLMDPLAIAALRDKKGSKDEKV